jgi:uncharacterized protein (DUF2252 family)
MAEDLASTPRSGLPVQCCGDAHLSNFGVFASPERRLVFDLNDFDETLLGPWEAAVLQIKEAQRSVLEDYAGASEFDNHGERVVVGQRLMQATGDIFLGWLRVDPDTGRRRDYYGRQLKDWKGSAEIEQMDPESLAMYGQMCGWTLARAHG